jgi:DNA-binding CsgD family transcriptional regulator
MGLVVGRERELDTLREFVAESDDGARALVFEGEAGIGKSTLWLAGVKAARERSLRVLVARPAMAERGLAHAGLGDLCEGVLDEMLPAMPAARRSALEVALLLTEAEERPPDARAVGVAILTGLRSLAQSGPLLIAVDDVQWLDASSAAALEFALRRLHAEPVLLLLARRVGEPGPTPEAALAEAAVLRQPVGPLSLGAMHHLLLQRTGHSFPRPTLVRMHEAAGGNPFFVLELARAMGRAGAVPSPGEPFPVPESLELLVRDRLDALPQLARPTLLAAAAVAEPAPRLLSSGWPDAAAALEAARRAGVVDLEGGRVRFTHPLLASVLYEHATPDERRGVHRRLAGLVEDPVEQARHLALATDRPDPDVARRLEQAATEARMRGASIAAAELGELAVRRTPPGLAEDRHTRVLRAARDHLSAGNSGRVRALAQQVLREAPPGRARAEALMLLAELEGQRGMSARAAGLLRAALGEVDGAPDLAALLECHLAESLRLSEGTAAAVRQARRAVELAKRVDHDALTARALAALARAQLDAGEPGAVELAERSLTIARRARDREAIDEALWAWGYCGTFGGLPDQARAALTSCRASVAGRDDPMESVILWLLALVELRAGNWKLAREYAEHTIELAQMLAEGESEEDPEIAIPLALVSAHQSQEVQARRISEQGIELAETSGQPFFASWHRGVLGLLHHWADEPAAAAEHLAAALGVRESLGFREPASPPYRADYVEALLQLGRVDEALAVLGPWERDAARLERGWALAETTRCHGLVAAARGELAEARRLLEEAIERHEAVGDPFGRARALLALGGVLRRDRQKRSSRQAVEQALAEFARLGARRWVQKARAETGSIGGRTREEGLTASERRVAELVAQGHTNREVAAALFLSERTVESHLTHVYAKLGVRSRTELAHVLQ